MNPMSLGRYIPGPWIQAFLLQDRFFDGQYDEMIDAMRSTAIWEVVPKRLDFLWPSIVMSQNYGTKKAELGHVLCFSHPIFGGSIIIESLKDKAAKPSDSVWGMYNLPVNDVMMDGEEEIGAGVQVNFDQARMYDAWRKILEGYCSYSSCHSNASEEDGMIKWVP